MTRRKEPRRPRIRRTWARNPAQRVHGTPKGGKGYTRSRQRQVSREEVRVSVHTGARKHLRIAVLLSGEGRELSKTFSYIDNRVLEGEIVAVIGDDPDAEGMRQASERGIRTLIADPCSLVGTATFSREINDILDKLNPDAVILDGFSSAVRLKEKANRLVTDRADVLLEMARPA